MNQFLSINATNQQILKSNKHGMWIRKLYNKDNVESKQRFRIDGVFPDNYNENRNLGREKQMEQKLLFFDIDGTLITEGAGALRKEGISCSLIREEL